MRTTISNDDTVRPITFHFNKGSVTNPNIPMWVIKHKGVTHYVHHVKIHEGVGLSTMETPNHPSVRGSLRFKGKLTLSTDDGKILAEIC
jgi:hypothetical protein